jgi:hypothetical protein
MNTCPDCKCEFVQPFRCATCGAQKLYDHTVTSQQQTIDALRARVAELEAAVRAMVLEASQTMQMRDEYQGGALKDFFEWDEFERLAATVLREGTF